MSSTSPVVPAASKSHGWSSPYLLLTLASLLWSLNWVVGRAVVGQVPPVLSPYWRRT